MKPVVTQVSERRLGTCASVQGAEGDSVHSREVASASATAMQKKA